MKKNDKRLTLKSFGVLNLAIVLATIVIYAFQLGATYINRFLSTSYEKTTLFYSLVFTIVFLLGVLEFLILYISRINNLSLKAMTFLVKEGYKPRFITAISTVFITSLISMLMGLSLGGEAPSLYLSGASFCLVFYFFYRKEANGRNIISDVIWLGGATGFGLAFQNPLAGLMMSLVGMKLKDIRWDKCFACLYSNILGCGLFGLLRMAYYPGETKMWIDNFMYPEYMNAEFSQLSGHGYLVLMLIPGLCLICAFIYILLVCGFRKLITRDHFWSYGLSLLLAVLVSGLTFIYYGPMLSGSGISIIANRALYPDLTLIFTMIGVRLALTLVSFDGQFFGGMVIPTISMGCLIGQAFIGTIQWSNTSYITNNDIEILLVVSMITFYACVSAKPFVALALMSSFLPFHIVILPALVSIIPIGLTIKFSKFQGLSKQISKIDDEDGVVYFHKRIHIRNFIRL